MTPFHLEILLHFCTSNARFPREDAPAFHQYAMELVDKGVLLAVSGCSYEVTEKGKAWGLILCWKHRSLFLSTLGH